MTSENRQRIIDMAKKFWGAPTPKELDIIEKMWWIITKSAKKILTEYMELLQALDFRETNVDMNDPVQAKARLTCVYSANQMIFSQLFEAMYGDKYLEDSFMLSPADVSKFAYEAAGKECKKLEMYIPDGLNTERVHTYIKNNMEHILKEWHNAVREIDGELESRYDDSQPWWPGSMNAENGTPPKKWGDWYDITL